MSFAVTPPSGGSARARICTFAVGDGVPALRGGLPPESAKYMSYEAETAMLFDPGRGCATLPPVRVRPGERTRVEFRFVGPVSGGVLSFDGRKFPTRDLQAGEEWTLTIPGEHGGGSHRVAFEAACAGCRIGAVKRYLPPAARNGSN